MLFIAPFVFCNLRGPIVAIRFWSAGSVRTGLAAMPKAPVDEHASSVSRENEIRFAGEVRHVKTVPKASFVKKAAD
jgi:hypothetical protein